MGPTIDGDSVPVGAGRRLAVQTVGDGEPVTVFAHPWAATSAQMRPLAAGLPGRRVLIDFEGHGRSPSGDGAWRYERHADDLLAVLEHVGSRRVVGQSMGAGATLRVLRVAPEAVEAAVLLLPPAPHRPPAEPARGLLARLHAELAGRDPERVGAALGACLDDSATHPPQTEDYLRLYARSLIHGRAPAQAAGDFPWAGLPSGKLPATRLLVLGQEGDRIHAAEDAREIAATAPDAVLRVYPAPRPMWREFADVRRRIREFLAAGAA